MTNDRDIEFTPSPTLPQGVDFTPETNQSSGAAGGSQQASGGQQASAPLDQAREKAQRLVSTAQERAAEQVQVRFDAQKQRAADSLSSVAETLRNTTQNFQTGQDGIGRYINEAADRVDNLAHYLHDRELNEIVDQVEEFARRQPVAFLGGAFALGVLGARFLKSSQGSMRGYGSAGHYSGQDRTGRIDDPERDAVGRPQAPGYAPPSERASSDYKAAGPRNM
ncbi:MAG: hypothetical protein KY464_16925 [Gemmatimonadetes bacterium]|nr:hypothetical protein [Gemmatimonadota bacterium]